LVHCYRSYRDAATGQGRNVSHRNQFTADLAPLKEGGYELAPAVIREDRGQQDGHNYNGQRVNRALNRLERLRRVCRVGCYCVSHRRRLAEDVEIASTVGNFLGGLFGKSVTAEPVSPPVQPQPPLRQNPRSRWMKLNHPLNPPPPPQGAPRSTVPEPARRWTKRRG